MRAESRQAGETLIEVLLALVILALSVAALLGALVTSITSAAEHRSLADLDTVLRSYVEALKEQIEVKPTDTADPTQDPWFVDCAAITTTSYDGHGASPSDLSLTLPSGYDATKFELTSIQYWNSGTGQFDPSTVDSAACTSSPDDQSGYQLLTVTGTAPNGVSETLRVGVRKQVPA